MNINEQTDAAKLVINTLNEKTNLKPHEQSSVLKTAAHIIDENIAKDVMFQQLKNILFN